MYRDRQGFGGSRGGFAPVKVGQEIDVKIEAVGEKGDGIAKEKGFVLFVPGVKEGDEVRIRVTKVLRNVGFAEVVGDAQGSTGSESEEQPQESEDFGEEPEGKEDSEDDSGDSEEFSDEGSQDSEDFGEEPEEDKKDE